MAGLRVPFFPISLLRKSEAIFLSKTLAKVFRNPGNRRDPKFVRTNVTEGKQNQEVGQLYDPT